MKKSEKLIAAEAAVKAAEARAQQCHVAAIEATRASNEAMMDLNAARVAAHKCMPRATVTVVLNSRADHQYTVSITRRTQSTIYTRRHWSDSERQWRQDKAGQWVPYPRQHDAYLWVLTVDEENDE